MKIQLKLGEKTAELLSFHSSLVTVVAAATGGSVEGNQQRPTKDPNRKDLAAGHGSVEDAISAINGAMRF